MKTCPILALSTLGLLLASACSPSSKNEQQYWDNHLKNLTTQATANPGFKTILDGHKVKAEAIMKEAKGLGDEEAKANKMKEANAAISPVLGRLVEVKTKSESLQKKVDDLNRLKLPKSKHARRNETVADAQATLREVKRVLAEAKPASEAQALEVIGEQVSLLISARGAADRSYKSLNPKKKKKSKKKKKKKES